MANKRETKGKSKSKRGITLISLVITIIVLLILAGISVTMLAGENNIIKKAGQAADETKLAAYKDEISLSSIGSIDESGKNNIEKVKQQLDNTEKYNTSILGDTLVIITKKENYVFEINQDGDIQFKGIKIDTTNAEPLMMRYNSAEAFWKEEYRTKISKVEIKNYITTSQKAIKEWDVSYKHNQSVMAWIEDDGNDGYVLYIAANGKIKMINAYSNSLFAGFTNLTKINAANLDITSIVNLWLTFKDCSKLERIDLSAWDTSNITSMTGMFQNCTNLKSISLNGLNTDKVQSINKMFAGCTSLSEINFGDFKTDNVTDMSEMFSGCTSLKTIDLSSLNTSKVENMNSLFNGCTSLHTIDISKLNTKSAKKMSWMFNGCTNLSNIKQCDFDISNVTEIRAMFQNCDKLEHFDLNIKNTGNVQNMSDLFNSCDNLKSVKISNWDTKSVIYLNGMFYNCGSLEGTLDFSKWNISNVENFGGMFFGCKKIEKIIMPGKNEKVTNIGAMFQGCWAKEIDISGITCQNVQSIRCMFHNWGMTNIEEPRKIDISSMVFDNITDHDYFIRDGYTSKDIVYVKDKAGQDFVIMQNTRNLFSTANVIIK